MVTTTTVLVLDNFFCWAKRHVMMLREGLVHLKALSITQIIKKMHVLLQYVVSLIRKLSLTV